MRPPARGTALLVAVVFVALLIGASGAMVSYGLSRALGSTERGVAERSLRAADAAVSLKIAKLMRFEDRPLFGRFADGTEYAVLVRVHPGGDLFRVTAAARAPGARTPDWCEVVLERNIAAAQSNFLAPIMAKQDIDVSGSATVHGYNYRIDGTRVNAGFGPSPLEDKSAIVSKGAISVGAGCDIQGNADASGTGTPSSQRNKLYPGADGLFPAVDRGQNAQPAYPWGTGPFDHFPTTPDQALNTPDGTSKARAQQLGTYFTSDLQYAAWVASLPGGVVPPNQLLYLDFKAPSPGIDLGSSLTWGNTYHTIIQHHPITPEVIRPRGGIAGTTMTAYVADGLGNVAIAPPAGAVPCVFDGFGWIKTEPDGDSVVKVPHVHFNGCLIIDDCSNMNSGAIVFGGICSLQKDAGGGTSKNVANGSAVVKYSSAAIDRAIAVNLFTGTSYTVRTYREKPRTWDATLACGKIGATLKFPSGFMPEDGIDASSPAYTSDGWMNDWGRDPDPANGARSDPALVNWVADSASP